MGVKGLTTYMERHVPRGRHFVTVEMLARDYVNKYGGQAVLIVDAMCLINPLYSGLDNYCGGQWMEFTERLGLFHTSFETAGFSMHYVFDGCLDKNKRKVWIRRHVERMQTRLSIIEAVRATGALPAGEYSDIAPGACHFALCWLQAAGARVYQSCDEEADALVARLAVQHKAVGVMSSDSDFLIYDSGAFLHTHNLKLDNGQPGVWMFVRNALLNHVRLNGYHLPLLATIMGNDIVSHTILAPFHRKLLFRGQSNKSNYINARDLVPKLANLIRNYSREQCLSWNVMKEIAGMVFPREEQMLQLVYDSVLGYLKEDEQHVLEMSRQAECGLSLVSPGSPVHRSSGSRPGLGLRCKVDGQAVATEGRGPRSSYGDSSSRMFRVLKTEVNQDVLTMARRRHEDGVNPSIVLEVLSGIPPNSGGNLEDWQNPEMPSVALILSAHNQNFFGLLLGVQASKHEMNPALHPAVQIIHVPEADILPRHTDTDITDDAFRVSSGETQVWAHIMPGSYESGCELVINRNAVAHWIMYPGNPMTGPCVVAGMGLPGGTPSLHDLWLEADPRGLRLRTLLCLWHWRGAAAVLQALPHTLVPLVVILHYLAQHAPINPSDVNAFLLTALTLHDHSVHTDPPRYDVRAWHIAVYYVRMLCAFHSDLAATNFPLDADAAMPWHSFDGKLFHCLYLQVNSDQNAEEILRHDADRVSQLQFMRQLVFNAVG